MKFDINWEEGLSTVKFIGDITIEDIELANKNLHGDNRLYKTTASIWDFTCCNLKNVKKSELLYSVAVDVGSATTLNVFKLALVATEQHSINLLKSYIDACQKTSLSWEFKIISSRNEAIEWIKS